MGCYVISVTSAIAVYALRRKGDCAELRSLNQLLAGSAAFGFIDHLWNGELWLSANVANDMLLGLAIVSGIIGFWAAGVIFSRWTCSRNISAAPSNAHED